MFDFFKKYLTDYDNRKFFFIGSIITIFLLVFLFFVFKQDENYKSIKEDKNQYLVYTKYQESNDNYEISIPYINIRSSVIKQVNDDISNFLEKFMEEEKAVINYEYDINGIILSLVVKVIDYDNDYAPKPYFRSYNINLKKLELIENDSLLSFFDVNYENVHDIIASQLYTYYKNIVEEGYYQEEECDYSCFLSYREINDYLDDVTYYVKNGNLIAYKPFVFSSVYGEEYFFNDEHFEFLIVKTTKE